MYKFLRKHLFFIGILLFGHFGSQQVYAQTFSGTKVDLQYQGATISNQGAPVLVGVTTPASPQLTYNNTDITFKVDPVNKKIIVTFSGADFSSGTVLDLVFSGGDLNAFSSVTRNNAETTYPTPAALSASATGKTISLSMTQNITTSSGGAKSFVFDFGSTSTGTAPTVTTASAASVGTTSALLGGNVTSAGSSTVTERGIVWATTANPTTANNKVSNGSGTGAFSATISSLPSGTTINFRAYATSSVGTSYGSNLTFLTIPAAPALPTASAVTATGMTINWTAVTGATDYAIDVSKLSDFSDFTEGGISNVATGNVTSKVITGLTSGVTYYFRIRAKNTSGTSSDSASGSQATTSTGTSVTSINRVGTSPTNASSASFTVTFATSVTGVDAADFTLTSTGTANGTIGTPTGSGTTWTVPITGVSGDGTLRLDFTGLTGVTPNISANFTSGQTYTLDHTGPAISSVTLPANGTYIKTATPSFALNLNEAVTVTGNPYLTITLNSGAVQAAYDAASSTSTKLVFKYTVADGHLDSDGISINAGTALNLNGGTIRDAAGNDASTNLTGLGATAGIKVDGVPPTVSSVTGVNGTYRAGQDVLITINFSEAVTVSGTPELGLPFVTTATYQSGSGSTALLFKYVVQAGDNAADLDYFSTGSLIVGTLTDASGNSATRMLPTPGATGSLGATSNIIIDTSAPNTPAGLTATPGNNQNVLNWNANAEADVASYKVYGGTTANPTTLLQTVTAPTLTYTHSGLTNKTTYYYRIAAVDNAGNQSAVSTDVTGVPNAAPTNITLSATSINENGAANATVGTLSSTDADGGETFAYALVNGTGSTDNGSFTITGNQLKLNASADYESKSSYSIRIRTTDGGLATFEKQFTITVNNINDAPTLAGGPYTFPATTVGNESQQILVSDILASLTHGDQDAGALKGIIVIGVSENGHWKFASNGDDWMSNPPSRTLSATNGLLLSSTDKILYAPGSSPETASFTFRAWDQTAFTPASVPGNVKFADPSTNGGTSSFSTGTATVSIVVGKQTQTISFTAPSGITYGDADITPIASATSGLALTYESSNTAIATIVGGKIHVLKAGIVDITAKQAGNGTYQAAADVTRTVSIAKKGLDAYIDNSTPVITKVYDRNTTATIAATNYKLDGIVGTDDVTVSGAAAYTTASAGPSKQINVTALALAGVQKDNYQLNNTSTITGGAITRKPITLTLASSPAITKTYNKTNAATLDAGNYSLNGIETGDAVTVSGNATYSDALAGTGKVVTVNNFVLAGADKDNYSLTTTSATTTGNITAKALTVVLNSSPAITRPYNNTNVAFLAAGNYSLSGMETGDAVTVSGTATYSDALAGTGKTVTANNFVLSGADKDNYSVSTLSATTTGNITKKDITLSLNAVPAITKAYDASVSATLAAGNYVLTGIQGSDAVTVSGNAAYDTKSVGTGKTVTANNFVLAGTDKDNYSLTTTSATTTGSITGRPLTVALNSSPAVTKVYDGNTSATLAAANYVLTGIQGSDAVTVSGNAAYDTKTVGTGKTVTANAFVLAGADKDNYLLGNSSAITTGTVTTKNITLSLNAVPAITKTYDASVSATLAAGNYSLNGIEAGDAVTVSGNANYDTKAVGTGKTVTANAFVLAGADKDNYSLTTTSATTTGSITGRPLTVALNSSPAVTKVYDGTTSATLAAANYVLTGIQGSDAVTVSGNANYDTKTVGTGKTVTANAFVLAGADKDNYLLGNGSAITTGTVTTKSITLSLNAVPAITKTYDASVSATLAAGNYSLNGIEAGDAVTVSGNANYDTKTVGTGKTVTANNFLLAGADKDNYSLTTTSATTTGSITGRPLTVALNSSPAVTKVYDGTTSAALAAANYVLTGIQGSDAVTVSGNANYDTKTVGTGKTITANNFVLAGADKDNYSLTTTSATTTGSITGRPLTVALNSSPAVTKVYDGTTSAALAAANYVLTGIQGSDAVTVSGNANYDTKTVGTGKTVTANAFVLAGADKDNYNLTTTSATTTGSVTGRPLTVALNGSPAVTKVYDGNTSATLAAANYVLTGIQGSDAVTVSGNAAYDTKTVGTGKTVTANAFVLAGADKDNYSLTTTSATTTGSVTGRPLTVALNSSPAVTKVYDGTTSATLAAANYVLTGIQGSDAVTVSGNANYDTKTVGTGKTVTANAFVLAGADKDNYSLTTTSATTTGSITGRPLTVALNSSPAVTKVYDGTTSATLAAANYVLTGIQGSDAVSVSGNAAYDTKTVGTGKTVTANAFVLAGADKDNYLLGNGSAITTGTVTTKNITLSLNAVPAITKTYDASVSATLAAGNYSLNGIEAGDAVTVSGNANYDTKTVGTGKTVTANNFVLAGADKDNYSLTTTSATTTGSITGRPLTVALNSSPAVTKVYDGTTSAALAAANYVLTGIQGSDAVTVSGNANYDTKTVGTGKTITANNFVLAGADKDNYSLTTTSATTTGSITGRPLTVALNSSPAVTKVYDGTTSAALAAANYVLTGIQGSDAVTVSGNANYDTKTVGTGKTVTANNFILAGADKDNYSLTTTSATTTGIVTAKTLTPSLAGIVARTYDGTTTASLTAANYALAGLISGDVVLLNNPASGAYDNKNVGTAKTVSITSISISGSDASNYTLSTTSLNAPIGTIIPKALVITADNKTRVQGTANPALTATYTGFVSGDNAATALSTPPTLSTTATIASLQGDYPITVSGAVATNGNYTISQVNGILTVTPGYPTSITLVQQTLLENQVAGTVVGTLNSTADDPNATFSYTLVAGTGSTDNGLFSISGNQLRTAASLDFESKSSYSILVRSTTQYGLSLDKQLTINLSNVNEAPTLAAIANQTICYTGSQQNLALTGVSAGPDAGQTTTLSVVSSNNSLFSSLNVNSGNNTLSYTAAPDASGSATVTVTVTDNGGTANGGVNTFWRSFTLTINPLPTVTITSSLGNDVSKGSIAILTATGGSTYQWANALGIISGQNTSQLTVRPSATTTYTVTATNASGCSTTTTITLNVADDYKIEANNVLSPNGDGSNDKWVIKNIDMYPKNAVKVFDRAGRMVYSKTNYTNDWNGTFNGSPLASGTYYYVVDFGPGIAPFKGFITIVNK